MSDVTLEFLGQQLQQVLDSQRQMREDIREIKTRLGRFETDVAQLHVAYAEQSKGHIMAIHGPVTYESKILKRSKFHDVDLSETSFDDVNLSETVFRNVALRDSTIEDANLTNLRIEDARLDGMTIDGVLVSELLRVYRAKNDAASGRELTANKQSSLAVTEIKAFVPSRNFALSKQFYRDIGFTMASEGGGVAYFHVGTASFLLQDFCAENFAENFMIHMLVKDVDAWWRRITASGVTTTYDGVTLSNIELQPWRMKDFCLTDPTGVIWRIGQNVG